MAHIVATTTKKDVPTIPLSQIQKFNIFRELSADDQAIVQTTVLFYVLGKTGDEENPFIVVPLEQFGKCKATAVSAWTSGFAAIMDTDKLYMWGWQAKPKPTLQTTTFQKVTASKSNLYGLTHGGLLFRFSETTPSGVLEAEKVFNVGADAKEEYLSYELYNEARGYSAGDLETARSFNSMDDAFCYVSQLTYHTIKSPVQFSSHGGAAQGVLNNLTDLWNFGGEEIEMEADISFSVEGQSIAAHKTVLVLRSTHFRRMLNGSWKESKQDPIIIGGETTYDTFKAFLAYLYTEQISFTGEEFQKTFALMQLADSYLETTLRMKCEKQLMGNLSVENVCYLLKNATSANGQDLYRRALNFFVDNRKETIKRYKYGELNETLGEDAIEDLFPLLCNL